MARACGDLFNDTQIYPSVGCKGAHTQSRASQWPPKAPETFLGESSRFNFTAHRALCAGTDTKPAVPSTHKWFTSKVESEAQCCLSHIERTRTKKNKKNKLVSFIDDRGAVAAAALLLVFCIQNKQAACPAQLHPDVHYVIRESRAAAAVCHTSCQRALCWTNSHCNKHNVRHSRKSDKRLKERWRWKEPESVKMKGEKKSLNRAWEFKNE